MVDVEALLWGKSSVSEVSNVSSVVLEDDSVVVPSVEDAPFTFGDFQLIGHGKQTNQYCGQYVGLKVCLNVDLHGLMRLDGKSYVGKIARRIVHNSCNRPSCPVCYVSWVMRTARKMAFILGEASKQFGRVEHLSCSVPVKDYGLSYKESRSKAIKVLKSRGVIGGSLIFHGARFNRIKGWHFSPHWHSLAFLLDGYKCRCCDHKNNCVKGCGGLDDVNWQKYQVDKWYVKILSPFSKSRNVRKTASYELGHCTVRVDSRHSRVVSYFGVVSYRKFKISDEVRAKWKTDNVERCWICGYELKRGEYVGVKPFVVDRNSFEFQRDSEVDYLENGRIAYVITESERE